MMSTLVFVDPDISTQADGAQSSRVPVPLPEDPYEAIRQDYLVRTNAESEPFKDPVETETPESPHIVALPTCHVKESEGLGTSGARSMSSDSTAPLSLDHPLTHTTPVLVPSLPRTIRMAVHVSPMMSPRFSVSIEEVAAMLDSTFCKSERDELGDKDDEDEDEEVEESLDSDSESEDAEDEGPTAEEEDPAAGDEGLVTGDEGPGMGVESLGLGGDEAVPEGQQRAAPFVETTMDNWKSRIKRYIDTKPNHELIHYCLKNPPYKYQWADKDVLVTEGSTETTTERAKRLVRTTNPLALVAQQQPLYHPQNHPTHSTQNSSTRSQQAATRNRGKEIVNSPPPIYDQEPSMVAGDDEIGTGYDNQRIGNVVGARETVEKADWRDDTDDESEDQELKAHYMYMAQIQEVNPDAADDSGPIFDTEPLQKVSNNDNYNVFAIESEHPKQSKSVNDTYPIEQDDHNVIIDSLDMSYDREQIDQDDDDDLANERDLLASLIEKLKCKIDDSKNRNKFVKTSNKVLVDKLKEMKKELLAHQETISILSQQKEAQIKFHKTREDKELEKVISLENKVKVLDNIVYKTGQTVQIMNMLNHNCKTSFAKPEFLKKAQRANPRLYDIGCYNNNLALMLAPEFDEVIRLEKESRSKLSDLIRPFDYEKLNNLYDLFVPQREKSSTQRDFSESVYTKLDEVTNLQCDYLETLDKCECLKKELSKSKMMSKSFEALQKHAINLELDLQQCQEKIKNDKSFKENQSKEFRKEREQYFESQDLKAQLQDKGIAISELKKLIERLKGKSMETKFGKSSVIRQPNASKSQRPSILGKPTIFSYSLERKDCSKSKSVTKNNVSNDFLKPVTAQILPPNKKSILKNTNVLAPGMYKLHTKPTETRTT
nr:hypothetical protein [Tanacetum cinerariifolium]